MVDIDQHKDAGTENGLVRSDGWGHPLIKNYDHAAYMVLGLAVGALTSANVYAAVRNTPGSVSAKTCGKPVKQTDLERGRDYDIDTNITPSLLKGTVAEIGASISKILSDLEGLLTDSVRFRHLYMTVDRDAMLGSRTQWKDTAVTFEDPAEIIKVLDAIVGAMALRGVLIAGFDVTGLPELDETAAVTSRLLQKTDRRRRPQVIADLKTELRDYATKFDAWSTLPRYQITVSSLHDDDSLRLNYGLRDKTLKVDVGGLKLDAHGKGVFATSRLGDIELKFESQGDSWGSVALNTNTAIGSARYTYVIKKL